MANKSPFQLVDTKSVNNTTLLHFLEKTISKHFPAMATFLDELEKPAEAYRGESIACLVGFFFLTKEQSTYKIYAKG